MKKIMLGERYRSILEKSLICHGFEAVWMPDNPKLDVRLAAHADLSAVRIGDELIVAKHIFGNRELVKKITNSGLKIQCCEKEQSGVYPNDINLCANISKEYIIHNFAYTDKALLDKCSLKQINVKQGYANCMILSPDGFGLISADDGIEAAAVANGLKVLKIKKGHIKLEGFAEGFIGGASFVCGQTVYFTGDIRSHPDWRVITDFINCAGMDTVCLNEGLLIDIGSAVILDQ